MDFHLQVQTTPNIVVQREAVEYNREYVHPIEKTFLIREKTLSEIF